MHPNLQDKLSTLTDSIYSQILCLNGYNGKAIVTICPPILASIEYYIRTSGVGSSADKLKPVFQVPVLEPYHFDDPCNSIATGVSEDLLLLGDLNPSLTEYLTSWTRAKNFYVDASAYHTQMAEFWLDHCLGPEGDSVKDPYVIYFILFMAVDRHLSLGLK